MHRLLVLSLQLALVALFLGTWQALADAGRINTFFLSSPAAIWANIQAWVLDGSILDNVAVTLEEAALGFLAAVVTGIPIGFLLARWRLLDEVLQPFIAVINATPRIALVSIFVLWFGIGLESKVALVYSVVVFNVLVNTHAGARSVDPEFLTMARLAGASRFQTDVLVVLPWCIPWILAAVRLGVAYALTAAVVAEIISAQRGLGFLIGQRAGLLDTAGSFAAIVLLMGLAWLVNSTVEAAERRLLRWRPAELG